MKKFAEASIFTFFKSFQLKLLLALLGLSFFHPLSAQSPFLTGTVVDAGNQSPISYVGIRIAGTGLGTLANIGGEFSLSWPEDSASLTLEISSMGYAAQQFHVTIDQIGEPLQFPLNPQALVLDAVDIFATELTAREMVGRSLDAISETHADLPHLLKTFYRHYCDEDGSYGRLIEAAVDVYDTKGHPRRYGKTSDKLELRLTQLRKSLDFTRFSAYQHVPIALNQTLEIDASSFRSVLSKHLYDDDFSCEYADTTIWQGQVVYQVTVNGWVGGKLYDAQVYVRAIDFALVKMETQTMRRFKFQQRRIVQTTHEVCSFQSMGGKLYLHHLLNAGRRTAHWLDSEGQTGSTTYHDHHVEIMVNEIQLTGFQPFTGRQPSREKMQEMKFDEAFWENYSVLKATPLESQIARDLDARVPLEDQFALANGTGSTPALQDELARQRLKQLLDQYAGTPVIIGFWDHEFKPGIGDLLRARKLAKTYADKPIALILVSLEPSEEQWRADIRKKGLYVGDHLRLGTGVASSIAQAYGVTGSPYFVLLGQTGTILLKGDELPSKRKVEQAMDQAAGK
ncbi:carboxypeptidase-like regulatory domain-containing protein [Pontibacter sp. G13]|uniref:carboxypeptidase-like regulatory domain-containing protein n=1 Tax=Pontibacter sp. G13 TaxID=3074898 RepID=UPI00288977F0|nr:carboxypeptidase-like regulatory domain-containing protein [Pontibacter sp. G13]WNJ16777.1 carboxypeptidase-like regulatory domain-containing protein [Pontibacter sp. G13]